MSEGPFLRHINSIQTSYSSRPLYSFRLVEFMLRTGLAILAVRRAGRSQSIDCVEHRLILRAATWAVLALDIFGQGLHAVVGTKRAAASHFQLCSCTLPQRYSQGDSPLSHGLAGL